MISIEVSLLRPAVCLSGNQETPYLKCDAHDGTGFTSVGRAAKRDSSVGIAGLILTEVSTEAGGGGCLGGWWAPTALKHSACPLGHTPPSVSPKHKHKTQNTKLKHSACPLGQHSYLPPSCQCQTTKHSFDSDRGNCKDCKIDDEDDLMIVVMTAQLHCQKLIVMSFPFPFS